MRPVSIEPGFLKYAEGSVLISVGNTQVHLRGFDRRAGAGLDEGAGTGLGHRRVCDASARDAGTHAAGGRQRTRGWPDAGDSTNYRPSVARSYGHGEARRADRLARLRRHPGRWRARARPPLRGPGLRSRSRWRTRFDPSDRARWPLSAMVAATSVGIVTGQPLLDLAYDEDSQALVDMNVFMTDAGRFVELQGTAEAAPFDRRELETLLALGGRRNPPALHGAERGGSVRSSRFMPVDPSLRELVERVGAFHITDRAMKRAQSAIESAIARGRRRRCHARRLSA